MIDERLSPLRVQQLIDAGADDQKKNRLAEKIRLWHPGALVHLRDILARRHDDGNDACASFPHPPKNRTIALVQ